jgi:hypothetical protein
MLVHGGRLAIGQAAKPQHRDALSGAGNARKVRPHLVVEKVLRQAVNDATHAPNIDGNFTFAVEIVSQGAQCHYMIEMNMSHQDIGDFLLRRKTQCRGGRAGVKQ